MGSAALRAKPVLRRSGSLSGLGRSLLRRRGYPRRLVRPVWGRRLLWRWQSLALCRAIAATVADETQVRGALLRAVADQNVFGGAARTGRDRRPRIRPVPYQRPATVGWTVPGPTGPGARSPGTLASRASSAGSDFVGARSGWVWALSPLPHAASLLVRWRRHLRR